MYGHKKQRVKQHKQQQTKTPNSYLNDETSIGYLIDNQSIQTINNNLNIQLMHKKTIKKACQDIKILHYKKPKTWLTTG